MACSGYTDEGTSAKAGIWKGGEWEGGISMPTFAQECLNGTLPSPQGSPHPYRIVESDFQPSKTLAKQDVCLKACRILHELNELDDHMAVKDLDQTLDDPDANFVDDDPRPEEISNSLVVHGKKNVRILPHVFSGALQGSRPKPGVPLWLYKLELETVELHPQKSVLANVWAPQDAAFSIGLLTRKPLPEVVPFYLFPKQATVLVKLELVSEKVHLVADELKTLERFYADVMVGHVMQIEDPLMNLDESGQAEGPLFVPVENKGRPVGLALEFATNCLHELETWNETDPSDPNDAKLFRDAVIKKKGSLDKNYYVVLSVNGMQRSANYSPGEDNWRPDGCNGNADGDELMEDKLDDDGLRLEIIYQTRSLAMLKSRYADSSEYMSSKIDTDNVMLLNSALSYLSPVPASLWLQVIMIPSAFKRLDGLLKAAELREDVGIGARDFELTVKDQPSLSSVAIVPMTVQTANFQHEHLQQPPVFAVLESLTSSSANDVFSYERLETLGDAVLKMVECLNLFLKYPTAAEGPLSGAKGRAVSNKNLKRLVVDKINKFWNVAPGMKPRENWLPPLFVQPPCIDKAFLASSLRHEKWDEGPLMALVDHCGLTHLTKENVDAAIQDLEALEQERKVKRLHELKNVFLTGKKTFADCTEALAGVYLSWTGLSGAWTFFKDWVGFDLLPWDELPGSIKSPVVCESSEEWMKDIIKKVAGVQERLGYVFKDPMFLVQALTHPSYSGNVWTPSYERLEFLGDAVLDYLVTVWIFSDSRIDTPGKLTRLRSALTCTTTLACLAVENNLHNDLLIGDNNTMVQINHFARKTFQKAGADWMKSDFLDVATLAAVPKALADVFEALVGAVFLDCGLDFTVVASVFYPWLANVIETYSSNVPQDPVSLVAEKFGAKFSHAQEQDNGSIRVECFLESPDYDHVGQCYGLGPNKVTAKRAAACYAIRQLKKKGYSCY